MRELPTVDWFGGTYAVLRAFRSEYLPQYRVTASGVDTTPSSYSTRAVVQYVALRLAEPVPESLEDVCPSTFGALVEIKDKQAVRDDCEQVALQGLWRALLPAPEFVRLGERPTCGVLGAAGAGCDRPVSVCWFADGLHASCAVHWPPGMGSARGTLAAAYGQGRWYTRSTETPGELLEAVAFRAFQVSAARYGLPVRDPWLTHEDVTHLLRLTRRAESQLFTYSTWFTNPDVDIETASAWADEVMRRHAAAETVPAPAELYFRAGQSGTSPHHEQFAPRTSAEVLAGWAASARDHQDAEAAHRLARHAHLVDERHSALGWYQFAAALGDSAAARNGAAILIDDPGRRSEGVQILEVLAERGDDVATMLLMGIDWERGRDHGWARAFGGTALARDYGRAARSYPWAQ